MSVYDEPVFDEDIFSIPVIDKPVYDEDIFSIPVYDKPVYDEDILSMPVYDKPMYDKEEEEEEGVQLPLGNIDSDSTCVGGGDGDSDHGAYSPEDRHQQDATLETSYEDEECTMLTSEENQQFVETRAADVSGDMALPSPTLCSDDYGKDIIRGEEASNPKNTVAEFGECDYSSGHNDAAQLLENLVSQGEDEDNLSKENRIKIQIPLALRMRLVDDWGFIPQQNKLVKLPRSPNVDDILTIYLEQKSEKDGMMSDEVREILIGLRCYFIKADSRTSLFQEGEYDAVLEDKTWRPRKLYFWFYLFPS